MKTHFPNAQVLRQVIQHAARKQEIRQNLEATALQPEVRMKVPDQAKVAGKTVPGALQIEVQVLPELRIAEQNLEAPQMALPEPAGLDTAQTVKTAALYSAPRLRTELARPFLGNLQEAVPRNLNRAFLLKYLLRYRLVFRLVLR